VDLTVFPALRRWATLGEECAVMTATLDDVTNRKPAEQSAEQQARQDQYNTAS
jgi:hypothetical protein